MEVWDEQKEEWENVREREGSVNQARQRCILTGNTRGPHQRIWIKTPSVLGKWQKTFKWLLCLVLLRTGVPLQMSATRNSRSERCQLPMGQSGRMEVSEDHPMDLSRKPWKWKLKVARESWPGDRGLATASLEDPAETSLTDPIPQGGHENEKRNPQVENPARAERKPNWLRPKWHARSPGWGTHEEAVDGQESKRTLYSSGIFMPVPSPCQEMNIIHKLDLSQTAKSVRKKNTNWSSKGNFELVKITFSSGKQNQVLGLRNQESGEPAVNDFTWSPPWVVSQR